MCILTPLTEASMMTVGHFAKIFDPGKGEEEEHNEGGG